MIRRIAIVLSLLFVMIFASGCMSGRGLADEDGNMWVFEYKDLTEGVYVRHKDGTYNPLLAYGMTFSGAKHDVDSTRMVWYTKADELIPELGKNDELIIYSSSALPTGSITFEHFTEAGYTVGAFFNNANGVIQFPSNAKGICSGSTMEKAYTKVITKPAQTQITELNGEEFPAQLVHKNGFLTGLSQGGKYQFGFFEGTTFREILVSADTRVWVEDAYYSTSVYNMTKDGYFVVTLPEEMPNGLYCVNGKELMYFTNSKYIEAVGQVHAQDGAEPTPTPLPSPTPIVDSISDSAIPQDAPPVMPRLQAVESAVETPAPTPNPSVGVVPEGVS